MQNNFRHGWQIPGKIGDWLDIHIEVYFSIFLELTCPGGLAVSQVPWHTSKILSWSPQTRCLLQLSIKVMKRILHNYVKYKKYA